jgi:uracil-DNA glycosylase
MTEPIDSPKSLKSPSERQSRLSLINDWHVAPLTSLVQKMRHETGQEGNIPFFDPCDGGVRARCLFLLEAPGAQAIASGFVSRNNNDESAKNFLGLNQEAGVPRTLTVIWNIVPWYIGSGNKIRPAQKAGLERGQWYLERMLQLLPELRIIVMMGQKASYAEGQIKAMNRDIEVLRSPHPSPLYINRRPGNRAKILDVFRDVALRLQRTKEFNTGRPVYWVPLQPAQDLSDYDEIVWVSISRVDASWQRDASYIGRHGTGAAIAGRYEKAGKRFEGGDSMCLPVIGVDETGEIAFSDGRHRFAWLRDHAATALPVHVSPDQASIIREKFGTTIQESSFFLNGGTATN